MSLTLANDRSNEENTKVIDKIIADYEWQSLIRITPFSRDTVKMQWKQGRKQLSKRQLLLC